jgi:hypothetical protein
MDTVGANTGTLYNGPIWATSSCVSGGCLEFDGADDYVEVPNSDSLHFGTGSFSISFWVKTDTLQDKDILVKVKNNVTEGWIIIRQGGYVSSRRLWSQFHQDASNYHQGCGFGDLSDGKFHLATVVVDTSYPVNSPERVKSYFDSSFACNGTSVGEPNISPTRELTIGKGSYSGGYFKGTVDEVRIYNAALTASAVRGNYLAGLDQLLAANQITQQEYRQRLAELDSTYAARE